MSNRIFTFYREDEKGEEQAIDVEVEYTCHKAHKGARDSLCGVLNAGPPLEPDEPAFIEIETVINIDTDKPFELTKSEEDEIYETLNNLNN